MKPAARGILFQAILLFLCMSLAFAQPLQERPAGQAFSQQEIDQMLAPIALYPDALLSLILMASTYPLEVVEAAHWSAANPGLNGDQAVQAVAQNSWDPSVKSLVAFPDILRRMEENLAWTERLGEAFLAQQQQLMDTVQNLRQRAMAQGNLGSNEQIFVQPQGQAILIEPVNPEIIYVPYYDPNLVYGPWWWAAYPPVSWHPWPGYYTRPGYAAGYSSGIGVAVGAGFLFGAFDWQQRRLNIGHRDHDYWKGQRAPHPIATAPMVWQHDPSHRRGIPYHQTSAQQKFGGANTAPETRRDYRGHEPASALPSGATLTLPPLQQPDKRGSASVRPEILPAQPRAPDTRDGHSTHNPVPVPETGKHQDSERHPHAFEGIGQGTDIRNASRRGHESLQELAPGHARPEKPPAEHHGRTREGNDRH